MIGSLLFAVTVVTINLHDSHYSIHFVITVGFLFCWYIYRFIYIEICYVVFVHVLKIIQSKNIVIYRKLLIYILLIINYYMFFWNESPFAFMSIPNHHFSTSYDNQTFCLCFYAWVLICSSKHASQVTIIITICRIAKKRVLYRIELICDIYFCTKLECFYDLIFSR